MLYRLQIDNFSQYVQGHFNLNTPSYDVEGTRHQNVCGVYGLCVDIPSDAEPVCALRNPEAAESDWFIYKGPFVATHRIGTKNGIKKYEIVIKDASGAHMTTLRSVEENPMICVAFGAPVHKSN